MKIKGNQSDTISIKLLNEVTTSEAVGNQSDLILTFIIVHKPSEAVDLYAGLKQCRACEWRTLCRGN